MENPKLSPSMILAAYAERLIEGRRVVVFGDSTSGLAEHLVDRGARLVHVYDPNPSRVAEATTRGAARNISFAPLGQSGIAVRDGAFDVGLVDELATAVDPTNLMRRLRRALAARGVALVMVPNPEAPTHLLPQPDEEVPSYYELYDLVCAEFDEVRMLGQTPFVGYAVAEFNPEQDDDFSIDTAFVPGGAEEPEYYVALASHFPVSADSFCVVQLPTDRVLDHSKPQRLGELERDHEQLELQAARLEQQLQKAQAEAETRRARSSGSPGDQELLKQARAELSKRDHWVQELEGRAEAADARADQAQSELEQSQAELEKARNQLERTQRELNRTQADLKQAEHALAATKQELTQKEGTHPAGDSEVDLAGETAKLEAQVQELLTRLDESNKELDELRQTQRDSNTDLDRLEKQLKERAAEIRELRSELKRTEHFGEQLVRELSERRESANGGANTPELQKQLEELAQTDARHVADLSAARWTIRELEVKLRAQEADTAPQLAAELEQAQAEIQRQATLIQQFRNKD